MKSIQTKIESLIEKDKLMHFCVGLLLAQFAYIDILFLLLPIGVGIAKELYDKYIRKTGFNWWDWIVTMLGCVPVVIVYLIL